MAPWEIKEKIKEAWEALTKLKEQKKARESERTEGNSLWDEMDGLAKRAAKDVSDFEEGIRKRTEDIPDGFGEYYRKEIGQVLTKGGIRDLDIDASEILRAIRSKVLDLDDIIEEFVRKILDKESWINELKRKLEELGEFVDDIIPGGD